MDVDLVLRDLRQYLSDRLPRHIMVPQRIFHMETLPLNVNLKVDRMAVKQWVMQELARDDTQANDHDDTKQ